MEERRGARLVTQRQLEVEPPSEPSPPEPESSPPLPPRPPPSTRPADEPVAPSNHGLLERQLRWHRERARFESARTATDETK